MSSSIFLKFLNKLCNYANRLINNRVQERLDLSEVDTTLNVMVDQVLTKQGLYKIFSMISETDSYFPVKVSTHKLNEFFYDLSFTLTNANNLSMQPWSIAQLFFTIQGLRHQLIEQTGSTVISVVLPVNKQINCLVIDDVDSVRRLIERMLGSYGIQVFGADNYLQALNIIELVKPDFIFLDILMPKMDGWQMIKKLKSNPETADIPVIICSVLFEPELSQAVNAAAHIRKPINRLELIQTLQDLNLIRAAE